MFIAISHDPLYLCLFHYWFYWFGHSLFFLCESGSRCVSFIYLFKEPALSFIDIFHCFFSLYFIYFCSDLYNFLLLTLCFVCSSFSGFFRNFFSHLPLLISIFFYLISSEYPWAFSELKIILWLERLNTIWKQFFFLKNAIFLYRSHHLVSFYGKLFKGFLVERLEDFFLECMGFGGSSMKLLLIYSSWWQSYNSVGLIVPGCTGSQMTCFDSAMKKNKTMPLTATWVDRLSYWMALSQTQKDKYYVILPNVESKKKEYKCICLQNGSRVTDVENKLMATGRWRE